MYPKHWMVASGFALAAAACGTSDNRTSGPVDLGAAGTLSTMAGPGGPGGGSRDAGGYKPPEGESGTNNISFPIILSDNIGPSSLPADGAWKFAPIANPATECIGEDGVDAGTAVDPSILCYFGRKVVVTSETGAISFEGDPKVWWLQQRPANFWKALSVGHDASTPLVVSAVDVGDLLESSPSVATRQIRVEFNLLQHVDPLDAELGRYVVSALDADAGAGWTDRVPPPCSVPTAPSQSVNCFAAVAMSGAVPGTQQSGNELQGTDFGPGSGIDGGTGNQPGTVTLLDPATVRLTTPDVGGIEAIIYSRCARLLIQKIGASPAWDKTAGQWSGEGAGAPIVNVAAYRDEYAAEINSGGGLVYGYNWNAKTAATGTYRLTFVLDGNDDVGVKCTTPLLTKFEAGGTTLVNLGESNPSHVIYAGDPQLGDEGGIAYLDLTLTTKGGGGKRR